MSKRVCAEPGCPSVQDETRCLEHRREREQARGTSAERGYDNAHRRRSLSDRASALGKSCHFCGESMTAGQPLALDHSEDRLSYRGVVHASCNASDGARRGNANR